MGTDTTLPGLTERRLRVLCFVGTRPEAVKLVPVVLAARAREDVDFRFVSSGQHPHQMLEVLDYFATPPDADLGLFQKGQTLVDVHERSLRGFSEEIASWAPHVVLVQGDTTSAMTGAMAAFYSGLPVGHIEAGLRTDDLSNPFPEEMNRRVIDSFAQFLFPPTDAAARHLRSERQRGAEIFVTGNTVVDTLDIVAGDERPIGGKGRLVSAFGSEDYAGRVLVTVHRRESWGSGLDAVAHAVAEAAYSRPDLLFLVPLHPNPIVRDSFMRDLPRNVVLGEPLPYSTFVKMLVGCDVVMTDSGGVLEEATSIGKQVVILRETTERPEALMAPNVAMVGTAPDDVQHALFEAIDRFGADSTEKKCDIFGDGRGGERIVDWLRWKFGLVAQAPAPFRTRTSKRALSGVGGGDTANAAL